MNHQRSWSACTVLEGRIVVPGGAHNGALKSIESYDHHENKWSYLPEMNFKRSDHVAVSICNKIFVVGGNWKMTGEVFDNKSRKFTNIKKEFCRKNLWYFVYSVVCIGCKFMVFFKPWNVSTTVVETVVEQFQIYDVLKG